MTRHELRRTVQIRVKLSGLSYRGFVRDLGLPEGSTTHFIRFIGGGKPMPSMLKALGYRRVKAESYEEIGSGRVTERRPAHR